MADYIQGFLQAQQAGVEARNDVTVYIRNWFANRNPLVTRLPHVPVGRIDFLMYTHKFRARSTTLGASISSNSSTSLTVADATFLMNHDVLEVVDSSTGNVERVQVNGDPTSSTGITVTRAVSGTTALSSAANGSTVYLIGNSRNGGEIDQKGLTTVGVSRTQYCQTFMNPVQISGTAQTTPDMVLPGGIQSPLSFNQRVQLQNMTDDIEVSSYYGIAEAPNDSTGATAKMNGLRAILATNNTTAPVDAAAYTSTSLIRDTLEKARSGGGEPDLLLVSTNFMSGFATWGQPLQRLDAGATAMGVPINMFEAPFLNGVTVVEAPLLRPYTAVALTSSEVYMRPKRNPFWNQRGNRGDAVEGEWISEIAIEVANESHHSWVEGITAFSPN